MPDNATARRRGWTVWLLSVVLLLLCGGLLLVAVGCLNAKDESDKPGMRAAAEAYLTAVVRREYGTAYDLLCARDRGSRPRATFQPTRGSTDPTGFRITAVAIERPDGVGGAVTVRTVTAEITRADYPSSEVALSLEKQGGAWKVCSPPNV
ncbi:MAG TPA: hypothetical protein VMU51_35190 [Mycobacteriales bacterium]|nr:hypothetical protein [Mycobacteriales bacterium]